MKKFAALLSALVVLFVNALACEPMPSGILPASSTESVSQDECTHWLIDPSSHELIGITDPCEKVPVIKSCSGTVTFIRGIMSDGLVRFRGRASIVISDDRVLGLTSVKGAVVTICPDYADLVKEIVARRTGAELSSQTVIASTMWVSCGTASHIFFTARHATVLVGCITVGQDTLLLWAGDFDRSGDLELGFMAGTNDFYVAPTATPEPTAKPAPVHTPTPEYHTPTPECHTPDTSFLSTTPAPTKCPCSSDTEECVDIFKLCIKLCITVKECVTKSTKQPDCGCK